MHMPPLLVFSPATDMQLPDADIRPGTRARFVEAYEAMDERHAIKSLLRL